MAPVTEEEGAVIVVLVGAARVLICSHGLGIRFLLEIDLRLSIIRRRIGIGVGWFMRTGWEHRRPIKARLLGCVLACKHLQIAILGPGHAVVCQLRVDIGVHVVRNVPIVPSDASAVSVVLHAARPGKLILIVRHAGQAIIRGARDDPERMMTHVIHRHVTHTIHVVHVALGEGFLRSSILLDMRMGMRKMAGSSGVSAANGALLKVTLENVTAGKRIATQHAHVRAVASV